jgi:peptide/nickel transport system permease protein
MEENKETRISTSDSNENAIASKETEGLSQRQIIMKRFVKHKAAMASLITLISIFIIVYTSLGITVGFGKFKFSIPGWWPYTISQIDPEGAIANSCNGGVPGCPTLDRISSFWNRHDWY